MREQGLSTWKEKGQYPIDDEGVLLIGPFWKKTMKLAEEKRNKKIYLSDVFIVVVGFALSCFIYMRLFG
jgi:hypothetical protein